MDEEASDGVDENASEGVDEEPVMVWMKSQ